MLGLSGGQKDPGFVRAALARLSAAAGALRVSGQRATVSLLIFLSVAMLVLGVAAVLAPALRAARVPPAEATRSV